MRLILLSIASGITASDDGKSYSAIFNWNTPDYIASTSKIHSTSVPEPSVILSLLGISGIFFTQRKLKKAQLQ